MKVYTAATQAILSQARKFVAFWKSDDDTISFYLPSHPINEWEKLQLSQWRGNHRNTIPEEELNRFDEVINAAEWHLRFLNYRIIKDDVQYSSATPGIYHPRIWRGIYVAGMMTYDPVDPSTAYVNSHIESALAASSLFDYLIELFRFIEPRRENFSSFGHKTRELLILMCTEIEAAWRGVLNANATVPKDRMNTTDYVRLIQPLHLSEWGVGLKEYPDLAPFTPFKDWRADKPTDSLPWYDAYNAVKHNRHHEFCKATLENLLNSAAALHILQAAQWGPDIFDLLHPNRYSPFSVSFTPAVRPAELYLPNLDGSSKTLAPQQYQF